MEGPNEQEPLTITTAAAVVYDIETEGKNEQEEQAQSIGIVVQSGIENKDGKEQCPMEVVMNQAKRKGRFNQC